MALDRSPVDQRRCLRRSVDPAAASALSISSDSKSSLPPPPLDFAGAAATVTESDCAADPPGPVQVRVKVTEAPRTTASEPLVGWLPVQPEAPAAVHPVAFWLLQVSCTGCPALNDELAAVKVTVGAWDAMFNEYKP